MEKQRIAETAKEETHGVSRESIDFSSEEAVSDRVLFETCQAKQIVQNVWLLHYGSAIKMKSVLHTQLIWLQDISHIQVQIRRNIQTRTLINMTTRTSVY